ncbi:MAG: thymidylate kinase, partial [Clostridia bacterium]|nr:thymidylate kinase [Clostridia bacterium]
SQRLMSGRYQGDESKKDIHEKDVNYLAKCREAAAYAAAHEGWLTVDCSNGDTPRSVEDIGEQVWNLVKECL